MIPADLSELRGARAGDATRSRRAGRHVDVLVNNAGFGIPQSFTAVPWARQRDFLMTMVVNACGLAYDVIPGMVERGGGADRQRRLAGGVLAGRRRQHRSIRA